MMRSAKLKISRWIFMQGKQKSLHAANKYVATNDASREKLLTKTYTWRKTSGVFPSEITPNTA